MESRTPTQNDDDTVENVPLIRTTKYMYIKTPHQCTIDVMLFWANTSARNNKGIIKSFYSIPVEGISNILREYNTEIDDFNSTNGAAIMQNVTEDCIHKTSKFFLWFEKNFVLSYEEISAVAWPNLKNHMIRKYTKECHDHTEGCEFAGENGFRLVGPNEGIRITYRCDGCIVYLEFIANGSKVEKKYTERLDTLYFLHSLDMSNLNSIIAHYSVNAQSSS